MMPTVVSAINMAIRAFSNPGDKVIIQQPVYEPFAGLIAKTSRVMVNNGLVYRDSRYEMDFALLEEQAADPDTKIMILCSPHNPVGRVWTKEELHQVGEICQRNHVLVISDEIHSDIVFHGSVHTPFPMASDAPHILCTAPGKTFNVAGLRISNMLSSSPEIKQRYDQEIGAYSFAPPRTFGLEAVRAGYSPEGEAWLEELLTYLEGNARIVEDWAKAHNVGYTKSEGTFLSWLDFSTAGLTDGDVMQKIMQLPKKMPELWNKSRFHVSNGVLNTFCVISLVICVASVILLLVSSTIQIVLNLAILAVGGILALIFHKRATINMSYTEN